MMLYSMWLLISTLYLFCATNCEALRLVVARFTCHTAEKIELSGRGCSVHARDS